MALLTKSVVWKVVRGGTRLEHEVSTNSYRGQAHCYSTGEQMMTDRLKRRVFKEVMIFLTVLLVGYLFSAEGPTNFRYPMSASPEVKAGLVAFGKLIMYLGYPILLLLRFLIRKIDEQRKNR